MKTNYVLIDYENVQPDAMAVLNEEHFKVIVFVGANQAKVSFDVASALQQMGEKDRKSNVLSRSMADAECSRQSPSLGRHGASSGATGPAE